MIEFLNEDKNLFTCLNKNSLLLGYLALYNIIYSRCINSEPATILNEINEMNGHNKGSPFIANGLPLVFYYTRKADVQINLIDLVSSVFNRKCFFLSSDVSSFAFKLTAGVRSVFPPPLVRNSFRTLIIVGKSHQTSIGRPRGFI